MLKKIKESKKTGNYPEKIQMSDDVYLFINTSGTIGDKKPEN